jgi:hypothetical protein
MTGDRHVVGIPATERAVVGLCHGLNDQLAAVSAYAFLLKRRGLLGEIDEPLSQHLERLAHSVRLVRSLCRNPDPEVGPVALSILAETAGELMLAYPEGPVAFRVTTPNEHDGFVLRCDWTGALRSLLVAAAWARRDIDHNETVEVSVTPGNSPNSLDIRVNSDEGPSELGDVPPDCGTVGITMEATGARSVSIEFATP